MKPMLTAPETMRLKLQYDKLLSNFACNVNWRRYPQEAAAVAAAEAEVETDG